MARPKRAAKTEWPAKAWLIKIAIPLICFLLGIIVGHYATPTVAAVAEPRVDIRTLPVPVGIPAVECLRMVRPGIRMYDQVHSYAKANTDQALASARQDFAKAREYNNMAISRNKELTKRQEAFLAQAEECEDA